jgi:hypothetical protein
MTNLPYDEVFVPCLFSQLSENKQTLSEVFEDNHRVQGQVPNMKDQSNGTDGDVDLPRDVKVMLLGLLTLMDETLKR